MINKQHIAQEQNWTGCSKPQAKVCNLLFCDFSVTKCVGCVLFGFSVQNFYWALEITFPVYISPANLFLPCNKTGIETAKQLVKYQLNYFPELLFDILCIIKYF